MHLYEKIARYVRHEIHMQNMKKYATLAVLMSESESKHSIGLIQVVEIKKTDLIMLL